MHRIIGICYRERELAEAGKIPGCVLGYISGVTYAYTDHTVSLGYNAGRLIQLILIGGDLQPPQKGPELIYIIRDLNGVLLAQILL